MKKMLFIMLGAALALLFPGCAGMRRTGPEPVPVFPLQYPGSEKLIKYTKYGEFVNEGSAKYRYQIKDLEGLKNAAGEGVYPNLDFVTLDTLYDRLKDDPLFQADFFKATSSPAADFFRYATAQRNWGVRQYFAAEALERGNQIAQAIKAYYSILVHFPTESVETEDHKSVWYVADKAIAKIQELTEKHPELGVKFHRPIFTVQNGKDLNVLNDVFELSPGRLMGKAVGAAVRNGVPEGRGIAEETRETRLLKRKLKLSDYGEKRFIDYGKYGNFVNAGGEGIYQYEMRDSSGLAKAAGEGVFPNESGIFQNPLYGSLEKAGWLDVECFESFDYNSPLLQYLKFGTVTQASNPARPVNRGEKLFFTAVALQNGAEEQNDLDLARQAVKAYYAVIIHFPGDASMARDSSYVWYPAKASLGKIKFMLSQFPALNSELEATSISIKNEFDIDTSNDTVSVALGRMVPKVERPLPDLKQQQVVEQRCGGRQDGGFPCERKVSLKKYENGHWQMFVGGKPYIVRGMSYYPTRIGESPKDQTERNWMFADENHNGRPDTPYDTWMDRNRNSVRDAGETAVGDFAMMSEMGVNAIRYYHVPVRKRAEAGYGEEWAYDSKREFDKAVLRDLYGKYGIRMIMGDYAGAYLIGSGADPGKGTDYRDPAQRERMKGIIRNLVLDHKDEDYVLMWALGNENNMRTEYVGVNGTQTLAAAHPEAWAGFLNEIAGMIHEIDPDHPVAVINLETQLIEYYEKHAPEIDILGINSYRGKEGFGDLFQNVKTVFDRPLLISEFGSDALDIRKDGTRENEISQMNYHKGTWSDIAGNGAGRAGTGNCIGGVIFEWVDEWWKSPKGPATLHDIDKDAPMPFQDGWSSEEYLGIMSQGDGFDSPFLRQPRAVYDYYREVWRGN